MPVAMPWACPDPTWRSRGQPARADGAIRGGTGPSGLPSRHPLRHHKAWLPFSDQARAQGGAEPSVPGQGPGGTVGRRRRWGPARSTARPGVGAEI